MKPTVTIEYCPKCGWLLRSAYMAQERRLSGNKRIKTNGKRCGKPGKKPWSCRYEITSRKLVTILIELNNL